MLYDLICVQLLQLLEIVIKNGDMLKTNKMAYNATWASVSSNDPSSVSDIYKDPVSFVVLFLSFYRLMKLLYRIFCTTLTSFAIPPY